MPLKHKTIVKCTDQQLDQHIDDGWNIQHQEFVPYGGTTKIVLCVVFSKDDDTYDPHAVTSETVSTKPQNAQRIADHIMSKHHQRPRTPDPIPTEATRFPPEPPAPIVIIGLDDPLPADTLDFDTLTFEDIVYEPWEVKREYIANRSRNIYQQMVVEPRNHRMNNPPRSPFTPRTTIDLIIQS